MSKSVVNGADVAEPTSSQVPEAAGEAWKVTESTPEPLSVASAASVIVRRRFAPGSVWVTAGAVESALATFVDV